MIRPIFHQLAHTWEVVHHVLRLLRRGRADASRRTLPRAHGADVANLFFNYTPVTIQPGYSLFCNWRRRETPDQQPQVDKFTSITVLACIGHRRNGHGLNAITAFTPQTQDGLCFWRKINTGYFNHSILRPLVFSQARIAYLQGEAKQQSVDQDQDISLGWTAVC